MTTRTMIRAFGILLLAMSAMAQTVSSTLKGAVQDTSGAVVAGATCRLTNPSTNASVTVTSGPDGAFQFLDVLSGNYMLTVTAPGFKKFELTSVEILASEFHSAGNIMLEVGQLSESVVVAESATPVQLSSG